MHKDIKTTIREKARLAKGLGNLLQEDTKRLYEELDRLDTLTLRDDVYEIKRSTQWLSDTLSELDYYLYLSNQEQE